MHNNIQIFDQTAPLIRWEMGTRDFPVPSSPDNEEEEEKEAPASLVN